ncbi:MAG: TatD family hydrolase [Bacillota bacterium]|jgi:TatD DNase family protein|nr:TatD family hydrolase [Bacillota bacterium]MDY0118104.1 TatD family hydrolase [Bacilli bacterium]
MFFDTHCHLNDKKLINNIDDILTRSRQKGVAFFVIVGWDIKSSKDAIKIAQKHEGVYAAVGIHPSDVKKANKGDLEKLKMLLSEPKVVAVGEIGLDFYWDKDIGVQKKQEEWFIKQIQIANEAKLPIIVHMREATQKTYEVLKTNIPKLGGVMHCYSGSAEMVMSFVELGLYISLGGPVTFLNAKEPKKVALVVPKDKLLIETDSPYLAPHPHRGKLNTSEFLPLIAKEIATLRNETINSIGKTTTENAKKLFHVKQ